jgi:LmbE family N-acetylglucosaminyl deacetylase
MNPSYIHGVTLKPMARMHFRRWVSLAGLISTASLAQAQDRGAPQLDQLVRGMATTARVLVIAAHPDDEDTQAIAWLARGRHVETAYLSLTRGDGGQNLIGNELGESLGAIRTEELLAARRLDGGRQYFTRAFDFGFSKNAEETMKHWPKDTLLADVVTVIRAFRPHVIYSIWSGTRADGHGHHEMAGLLAREAFDAALDTVRFPARRHGEPWAPSKLYLRGAGIALPVHEFDPILGRTYRDIATESRSLHRSQGFADVALQPLIPGGGGRGGLFGGSLLRAATRVNQQVEPAAEQSIFEGIDTTFARLLPHAPVRVQDNLEGVSIKADSAFSALDFRDPSRVAPILARMAAAVQQVRGQMFRCALRQPSSTMRRAGEIRPTPCTQGELDLDAALETLERRSTQALVSALQLQIEARAPSEFLAFGDSMPVNVAIVNRGKNAVRVSEVRITGGPRDGFMDVLLRPDSSMSVTQSIIGFPDARPWWLGGEREDGYFNAKRSPIDGVARVSNDASVLIPAAAVSEEARRITDVRITVELGGVVVVVNAGPVVHRVADPLLGVQNRPISGVPAVTIEFDRNLEWFPAGKPIARYLRLTLKSYSDQPQTFAFRWLSPQGLKVDSIPDSMTVAPRAQMEVFVRLSGSMKAGRYPFGIAGEYPNGAKFAEGFSTTVYPHIRPIYRYRTSAMWMQVVEVDVPQRLSVAYVQGVGDDNAVYLRQLGVPVTVIQPAELPAWDLSRFSTVVLGPRVAEANRGLLAYAGRLMEFARNGGTLVVQYGTTPGSTPQLFPHPLEWSQPASRVTVEDSPVTVLDARSKLLTFPNRIGEDDWKGWVQERALYMPSKIDPKYVSPIEMHDPDEPENRGAVLATPVGKGMFVFTSLALFRQLPNAVPGSARLFVNLLSAGLQPTARPTP